MPAPAPSSPLTVCDYYVEDPSPDVGRHSTIGLDAAGRVHIVYCDWPTQQLKHSSRDGSVWHAPQLLPILDLRCDNYDAAIAQDGYLHVAYQSGTGSAFKYAYQNASGWHVESVAGETTVDGIALALDADGYPHVAYRSDTSDGHLMYTHKDASGWWNPEVVDSTVEAGWYTSLAVDASGRGHVSYSRMYDTQLWYARRGTTGWMRWAVDPEVGLSSVHSSLALTSGGYPHICYYGMVDKWGTLDQPAFQYVYRDAGGWQGPYILDDSIASASDWECSLAIDGSDFPHMTYHRDGRLQHFFQDAQSWWTEVVAPFDGENAVGEYNSLAVAYSGQPFVSYYSDADGGKLMYAGGEVRAPALVGNTSCAWGDEDCNRCAEGLATTFERLYPRGDILGFHLGDFPDPYWGFHNHWQGVTRLSSGTGQYLVVTQDEVEDEEGEDRAAFGVVRMGSRNDDGQRFRSNRLDPDEHVLSTAPPPQDVIVHTEYIPADPSHVHPGSVQAMGNLMAVGVDHEVHLYNFAVPDSPYYLGELDLNREGKTGSSVAMAQLQDGRYLLVIAGSEAQVLDFYVSYLPHSYAGFWHFAEWSKDDVHADGFDWGWNSFQSISLVTDCADGQIYLIGTGNFGKEWIPFADPWGPDWAGLYTIGYEPGTAQIAITKVSDKHLSCTLPPRVQYTYEGDDDPAENCNLDAAGGAYVDRDGVLFLYATEHDNLGPEGSVKAMEFRPQPHQTCTTITDAWVELFEHDTYRGVNMMIDYVDTIQYSGHHPTNFESHWDYKEHMEQSRYVVGLNDEISSVMWCLPQGWAYRIYKHTGEGARCGKGKFLTLYGTGKPLAIPDLKVKPWSFGDIASCSFYAQDPPIVIKVYPGTGKRLIYAAYVHEASALALSGASPGQEPPPDADMVTIVDLPAGAVGQEVTLTYTPTVPLEPADPPLTLAQRAFDLDVAVAGVSQPGYLFGQPVEVTIRYHDDEVDGIDEGSLSLYRWDPGSGAWQDAVATCNPAAATVRSPEENTLSLSICQAGHFALMGTGLPSRVLYDEAHDSQKTIDWDRALELSATLPWNPDPLWIYYGELVDRLSDEFAVERNADAPLTADLLAGYEALILDTHQQPLAAAEVQAVRGYVAGGGGLLLLGECSWFEPNPELPAGYDLGFDGRCLLAPQPVFEGTVVVTDVVGHAASGDAVEYIHNWGSNLVVGEEAMSIADTLGADAWRDDNVNDAYDVGEEGVFDVMAVYDAGCGRVAALADGTFADADLD
ncbi:MAG: hypothetical protein P8129_19485, partial [Anaerolineae bacterium]